MNAHCLTCTCTEPDEVQDEVHSCQWCAINLNHPRCPENDDEERCPHCGSEPEDVTCHRGTCPTLGTCAQTYMDLPRPWHPESEWLDGAKFTAAAVFKHLREHHAGQTGVKL